MKKILCLGIIIFVFVCTSLAQSITMESYQKAREILDKSLVAYGGLENLRGIENYSLLATGDTVHRNQSRRTDKLDRTAYRAGVVIDFKNNRFINDIENGFPGAERSFQLHDVFDGKERNRVFLPRNTKTTISEPAGWRTGPLALDWLPQLLLLNAYERSARLRYLGKANFDNRPHEVILITSDSGRQTSFYIDSGTYLLSKLDFLGSNAIAGDAITEYVFQSHKTVGKFKVPDGRIVRVAGETTQEVNYTDVSFNRTITDDEFKISSDIKAATPTPANRPPVNKLAENIYTVNAGGNNVLFVGFKDYIFVMEAPGFDTTSREAIAKIKETIPNKPIKYLAVTHHHSDHVGGLRTYIAEGTTLITTKGNRNYFEQMAKARFTISPDLLTTNPQPLKMEFVENGKRVFTDGVTTVELYDIGAGPHAEEMLVAYFPNEKIIFEGDLADRPGNGDPLIANVTTEHFAKWIETKKLAVERIVPVHGAIMTIDELRKGVAELQKAQK